VDVTKWNAHDVAGADVGTCEAVALEDRDDGHVVALRDARERVAGLHGNERVPLRKRSGR